MAECGIKKYDDLPATVGWIDVDYLRWRLYVCDHPNFIDKIPILNILVRPPRSADVRKDIVQQLEVAVRHELRGRLE